MVTKKSGEEPKVFYPDWAWEMLGKFQARIAHMFLLHLNVADYVYDNVDDKYISLKRYLIRRLLQDYELVVFYDCSGGINFASPEMKEKFIKIAKVKKWVQTDPKTGKIELPREAVYAFPILEQILETSAEEARKILYSKEEEAIPRRRFSSSKEKEGEEKVPPFAAVVIGFTEAVAPAGDLGSQGHADRGNIVTLARWARRSKIEESNNVVIMMTNSFSAVASILRLASSKIEGLKIPLPERQERLDFINWLDKTYKFKSELKPDALANLTAGLTRINIEDLVKRAVHAGKPLNADFVWEIKKKILEAESGGLIEVVRPRWGFEVVGGLDYAKNYLLKIVKAVKAGDLLRVPMGVLLLGPPGTGKTIMAEALAKQLGFAMIKLKNIREMWVGQSERNQDLVFELIRALAPVIVFEDEVDQKGFIRGEGIQDNTGVSQRLFAAQLAFMSDTTLRGKVIWLSATNRPDLMDAALLREGRYDCKVPFLPPDEEEQLEIFKAIFRKMASQAEEYGQKIVFEVSEKELKEIVAVLEGNCTGAEIEVMCARAYDISADEGSKVVKVEHLKAAKKDFIPSKDEALYEIGIDLALQQVNFMSLIPERYRERAKKIKDLSKRIKELKESGGLTR